MTSDNIDICQVQNFPSKSILLMWEKFYSKLSLIVTEMCEYLYPYLPGISELRSWTDTGTGLQIFFQHKNYDHRRILFLAKEKLYV